MRRRRKDNHGLAAGAARLAGSLVLQLWERAARRPVDSFAILAAGAATLVIIVNAVLLQSGSRPAPFLINARAPMPAASAVLPKLAEPPPLAHSAGAAQAPQAITARRTDPIAELIGMSSRIVAVQRVLSDYGYGQITPSGVLDQPTSAAIEKFEREHKLPVTGRISGRLVTDLSAMVGHPL